MQKYDDTDLHVFENMTRHRGRVLRANQHRIVGKICILVNELKAEAGLRQ